MTDIESHRDFQLYAKCKYYNSAHNWQAATAATGKSTNMGSWLAVINFWQKFFKLNNNVER